MADSLEREYRPARDESQSAHLQAIVDKMAKTLPNTHIHFKVLLVDSSEVNGFSIAGGHIYLTRKLAAAAQSDDELAAVLGHEMGHIVSHQFVFETTRDLQRLLGITSVGDRADVYAKFQKLMDARYLDKHPGKGGDSDDKQDEADRIGVYVAAAAGYKVQAGAELWNRVTFTEGKTGSRFGDLFGMTKPTEKRLRGMLKMSLALPPGCGSQVQISGPEFAAWHRSVIANQAAASTAHIEALAEVKLTPPLRMDLDRLRFSRDGKMVLAQDEGSVFAMSREPFAVKFRFDAVDALPAEFSPDSKKIVFGTPGLHTEEWSVTDQKLIAAHEPLARHTCTEAKLSPDGRTVVCIVLNYESLMVDLALLDAETGNPVWEKSGFFEPSYAFAIRLIVSHVEESTEELMPSSFSADGNYLLIGPAEVKIAFDMRTRTPIKIGGDLKNKVTGAYAFMGSDRVAGVNLVNNKDSGVFSFPEGKQIEKHAFAFRTLKSVSGMGEDEFVMSADLKDYGVGIVDLRASQYVLATKTLAIDAWNGYVTSENGDGSVAMMRLDKGKIQPGSQRLTLPVSPLGTLRSIAVSPDGKFLAMSTRGHGGVWNLTTGERVFQTRGFSNAAWDDNEHVYAEFPKFGPAERRVVMMCVSPHSSKDMTYTIDAKKMHMEFGHLVEWKDEKKGPSELVMYQVADANQKWSHRFEDNNVRYTTSYGGKYLIFTSSIKANAVKNRMKVNPALAAEAAAIKNKDGGRLVEVLDLASGKTSAEMVLELPLTFAGTNGLDVAGDTLYVQGSDNRTMAYSLTSGKQLRQLFGFVVAVDPETGRVCTKNRRDEAVVYDAEGKELAHFRSGSPLRYASFNEGGKKLILVTADQTVRVVDAAKGDAGTALASN